MKIRLADCPVEPTVHGTPKRVLVRSGEVPPLTQVAVAELGPDDVVEPHAHPTMIEMYFVLEGTGLYRIGDDTWEASPGDFLRIPAGTPHAVKSVGGPHRFLYWGVAVEGK